MDKKKTPNSPADILRRQAEEKFKSSKHQENIPVSHKEARELNEREMQNEELHRTQDELSAEQSRYFNLYNLAPVGYATVSEKGWIIEANLTTATLLGVPRNALLNKPFVDFIFKDDQDIYYLHKKQLFESEKAQQCEVRMVKKDGNLFWAGIAATVAQDENGDSVCLVVLSDITDRKFREDGYELTAHLILMINTPGDFRERLSSLTASLQKWSGCDAVGIRLRDGDDYPYYETRGFPSEFIHAETHLCAYSPEGKILRNEAGKPLLECMCGNVLNGRVDLSKPFFTDRGSFWTNSMTELLDSMAKAPCQIHTRKRCHRAGYESVALIPLRIADQTFGLLQFNDHRKNQFTPEIIVHYERMADSLAVTLSRHQVEDALRTKNLVFDSSIAANSVADLDGVITEANETFLRIWGYPDKTEIIGRKIAHFFNDPGEASIVIKTLNTKDQWEGSFVAKKKDGSLFFAQGLATSMRNETGKLIGYQSSVLDITARKRMEEELARSAQSLKRQNDLFASLLKNLPLGVFMVEAPSGKPLLANDAALNLLGRGILPDTSRYNLSEIYKAHKSGCSDPYPPDEMPILRGMNGKLSHVDDMVVERPDGTEISLEIFGSPVTDEQGHVWASLVSFIDITDRKKAEAEQERLQNELRQSQKLEAVGQLAGGIAHDFNNIIMSVMGCAELCREDIPPGNPGRQWLDEIITDGQRAADITKKLLAFARKQPVLPKVLDLNETAESMLKLLRRLIGERIKLVWLPGTALWPVQIDPTQIDQILVNLCVNARDAIHKTGTIRIETANVTLGAEFCADHTEAVQGDYVQIVVSDNGCGMESGTLAHIFEPFFTTKETGKGTGLGLATVYGVVKQNNGFISVNSKPGEGTVFKINLPRAREPAGTVSAEKSTEIPKSQGETVLLVEDDESVRLVCNHNLENLGYKMLVATTPAEALDMSARYSGVIHLLLTDVVMPELDGQQLANLLLKTRPDTKVLLMSGYPAGLTPEPDAIKKTFPFIGKPFSRIELARKVREVLVSSSES